MAILPRKSKGMTRASARASAYTPGGTGAACGPWRWFRRERTIGVGKAGAEHDVGPFRAEILCGRAQNASYLVGCEVGLALNQQRHDAADLGRGIRGAGGYLIAAIGAGDENLRARRGYGDVRAAIGLLK